MIAFPPQVRRIAVLGDIGGQLGVLHRVLSDLGVVADRLPEDLALIQVGDLVRVGGRGLDDVGCLAMVSRCMRANPGRWVQLAGNHDLALLGGPRRQSWPAPSSVESDAAEILRDWWEEGRLHLAVALGCREYGDVLITHAGLTRGAWRRLGCPADPYTAAELIDAERGRPVETVARGGALTGVDSGPDAERADVIWAEVSTELYAPWIAAGDAPFSQIHGHASPWNWAIGNWWPDTPTAVRTVTTLEADLRRTTICLGPGEPGPVAVGVDWMLGDEAVSGIWPLLVLHIRTRGEAVRKTSGTWHRK